jgi:hypothetical protein
MLCRQYPVYLCFIHFVRRAAFFPEPTASQPLVHPLFKLKREKFSFRRPARPPTEPHKLLILSGLYEYFKPRSRRFFTGSSLPWKWTLNSDTVFMSLPGKFRGQHINSYSQVAHRAFPPPKNRRFLWAMAEKCGGFRIKSQTHFRRPHRAITILSQNLNFFTGRRSVMGDR